MEKKQNIIVKIILKLISLYQKISALMFPAKCRFYPSCSQYSYQSFKNHGLMKGLYFSIKRILKCHPFHPGGIDLVEKSS